MAGEASVPDAGPRPYSGAKLALAGFVLAFANFMVVLDLTIANVSVPHIAGGLAVSPSQGTWVITSYAVAEAITVPLTGWLARRFGAVRCFWFAMASFAFWSAMCGLAPSLGFLVVCRVMQGLSGGPMIPLSQTLMLRIFPPEKASAALGLWAMTTVVAPIAGPVLGGILCDTWGWEWVFYINVLPALACAFYVFRNLGDQEGKTERARIDFVGLLLLIIWVSSMQIILDKGQELDWFGSSFIVVLALIAVFGFVIFAIWELTDPDPIVDLRIFRYRGFTMAAITISLGFGAYFAQIVLIPLWLQTSMGYTATIAGEVMAFNGMLAVVLSPITARLLPKFDGRMLVSFGLVIMALMAFSRSSFATNVDFWTIVWPNFIQGIGVPLFFVPLTGLALSSVNPRETASAAGLINFMRTTAGAFGTSIVTTQWTDNTTDVRSQIVGRLNDAPGFLDSLAVLGPQAARYQLSQIVQQQAVMVATNRMFQYAAAVMLVGAILIWLAPRSRGRGAVGGH